MLARVTPATRTDIPVNCTIRSPSAYMYASAIANGAGSKPNSRMCTSYVTTRVFGVTGPRHFKAHGCSRTGS
jgi:hypothetical protein